MTQVIGLDHAATTVADLEASCAFYRDLFGSQPVFNIRMAAKWSSGRSLHKHNVSIIDGPSPRQTADGLASQSV